jgi:hypothetical protein
MARCAGTRALWFPRQMWWRGAAGRGAMSVTAARRGVITVRRTALDLTLSLVAAVGRLRGADVSDPS